MRWQFWKKNEDFITLASKLLATENNSSQQTEEFLETALKLDYYRLQKLIAREMRQQLKLQAFCASLRDNLELHRTVLQHLSDPAEVEKRLQHIAKFEPLAAGLNDALDRKNYILHRLNMRHLEVNAKN